MLCAGRVPTLRASRTPSVGCTKTRAHALRHAARHVLCRLATCAPMCHADRACSSRPTARLAACRMASPHAAISPRRSCTRASIAMATLAPARRHAQPIAP
ncbi:hypothetical protein GUJ93_ZPchr0006g40708 [Zizania palustris]|uniref:Uncharacterized protein n=1 Tax=Zizania palustris TaxID=103762 RepID=A0A8J5SI81_ZIZPA|nr:hypothetical protein GUJ93_ZPchr0006g40708 [Zizania palustris]